MTEYRVKLHSREHGRLKVAFYMRNETIFSSLFKINSRPKFLKRSESGKLKLSSYACGMVVARSYGFEIDFVRNSFP